MKGRERERCYDSDVPEGVACQGFSPLPCVADLEPIF